MNEITYLDYVQEAYPTGRKPAKISQDKIKKLKNNYNINWKTLKDAVKAPLQETTNVAPFPSVQSVVSESVVNSVPEFNNVVPLSNANQSSIVTEVNNSAVKPIVKNYESVVRNFGMTVYEKSFDTIDLAGAKKLRITKKTKDEAKGCSLKMAKGIIENIVPFPSKSIETSTINNIESKVVEFPKNQVSNVNFSGSPSVDDYLQKDKPSTENGIILQLAGDVENLKEQTVKQSALLEQLETKYNELKAKREQRIKELEEEKLSYTATLEGLTERIRNLQEAIQQEEKNFSGTSGSYGRVA